MIGYHRLWEAMALHPVEELSDEGDAAAAQPTIPKPKGKAKSKPKAKSSPKKTSPPKNSPKKTKPQKRPAKADPPSEAPKAKPAMKRPAAADSPPKEKVKVAKGFYQRDNKYGFKVNGREVFYVA